MKRRNAFTMIELVFVIVVIGILAKFGVEFLIKAYDGYIFSTVQNKLQTQTETALEQIANRLQYRIKPSIIARDNDGVATDYRALANSNGNETILEWVGYDIDGLRGTTAPTWSGFIDLASSSATILQSLGTNPVYVNSNISTLSNGIAGIADSAIYFIGGNSDVNGFGWGGTTSTVMHKIGTGSTQDNLDVNVTGQDAYEYYQLAWSAYALVWSGSNITHNIGFIASLDNNVSASLFGSVLPSALSSGTQNGQWRRTSANNYVVKVDNTDVAFVYHPSDGNFTCTVDNTTAGQICKRLIN